jgi:PilZ domain
MINQLLVKLGLGDGSLNANIDTRRKNIRHAVRQADVVIGGQAYAMRDWSMNGVAFETMPDARLMTGERVTLVMRFRFPDSTITIEQPGRVVRNGRNGAAVEFLQLMPDAKRGLERVLDSLHAQEFLQSQMQVA